jgi:predicted Zn-dependent protease
MTTRAYNLLNSLTDDQTVDEGISRLLLSPEAATLLLREFSDQFKLSDRTRGSGIQFPAALNLVDDPGLDFQVGSVPFDDEGIGASETFLIRKGIRVDAVSDLRTGFVNGAPSTGNGFRGESAFPETGFSNLYIKPSVVPLKKVMDEAGRGILVSLVKPKQIERKKSLFSAYGYKFAGEELQDPVHFYFKTDMVSLFLAIQRVSREIKFFHSQFNVGSPYLLVGVRRTPDGWYVT